MTKPQTGCLTNVPDVNRFVGGPVCGNLFVEHGEQCDCGTPQVCLTPSPAPCWSALALVQGPQSEVLLVKLASQAWCYVPTPHMALRVTSYYTSVEAPNNL